MVSSIVGPDEIRPLVEPLIMLVIVIGAIEAVRRVFVGVLDLLGRL